MDCMQRRSEEVPVKNRMAANRGKGVQRVGAATVSAALVLKTVKTVAPTAAPQKTNLVGGGVTWNMTQGGAGSERQQGASEMNDAASGRRGSGSGLGNVVARPFPAAATSAQTMAPAAAAVVVPAPAPVKGCVTFQSPVAFQGYEQLRQAARQRQIWLSLSRCPHVWHSRGSKTAKSRIGARRRAASHASDSSDANRNAVLMKIRPVWCTL